MCTFIQVPYDLKQTDEDRKLFSIYGTQRLDFLIIDNFSLPILAIEYQGSGHYGKTENSKKYTELSDDTKKEALKQANVPLLEVPEKCNKEQLREDVDKYLQTYMNKKAKLVTV